MRKLLLMIALLCLTTSAMAEEEQISFTVHLANENVEGGLIFYSYLTDAHNKKLKDLPPTSCIAKGMHGAIQGKGIPGQQFIFVTGEVSTCENKNKKFPAFAPNFSKEQTTFKISCKNEGNDIRCWPVR
jgi:hypothetical protein